MIFFKVGYIWSFYHSTKVDLAVGSLHITRVAVGLTAESCPGISAHDVKTTVPLPFVAFGLTYHINPEWMCYKKSEFFRLSFDNLDGVYTDNRLGT